MKRIRIKLFLKKPIFSTDKGYRISENNVLENKGKGNYYVK